MAMSVLNHQPPTIHPTSNIQPSTIIPITVTNQPLPPFIKTNTHTLERRISSCYLEKSEALNQEVSEIAKDLVEAWVYMNPMELTLLQTYRLIFYHYAIHPMIKFAMNEYM
jgi:hypothetical protein